MKTSPLDYVLSTIAITLILLLAVAGVWALRPLTTAALADYHVVADFLLLLLFYGLLSAVAVRVLLRVQPIAPGEYDGDSPVFTFWKLITIVYRLGQGALLPFTTVFTRPVVEALYGARVGADVAIGGTID
ncbi:MAG TPA: hypothetical protein PLL39_11740, partial [Rhodocyclaceae bacterium]|nr:hypothetical protein [Rhodocyclaceae bacterium]